MAVLPAIRSSSGASRVAATGWAYAIMVNGKAMVVLICHSPPVIATPPANPDLILMVCILLKQFPAQLMWARNQPRVSRPLRLLKRNARPRPLIYVMIIMLALAMLALTILAVTPIILLPVTTIMNAPRLIFAPPVLAPALI